MNTLRYRVPMVVAEHDLHVLILIECVEVRNIEVVFANLVQLALVRRCEAGTAPSRPPYFHLEKIPGEAVIVFRSGRLQYAPIAFGNGVPQLRANGAEVVISEESRFF